MGDMASHGILYLFEHSSGSKTLVDTVLLHSLKFQVNCDWNWDYLAELGSWWELGMGTGNGK